jgi:hypothetical protein
LGEARLYRGVAPTQRIVLRVGDLRRVLLVVKPVVVRDLACEAFQLRRGFLR